MSTDTEYMFDSLDRIETLLEEISRKLDSPPVMRPWPEVTTPGTTTTMGCSVCGIGANGETIGYVCTRGDCPSAITYSASSGQEK